MSVQENSPARPLLPLVLVVAGLLGVVALSVAVRPDVPLTSAHWHEPGLYLHLTMLDPDPVADGPGVQWDQPALRAARVGFPCEESAYFPGACMGDLTVTNLAREDPPFFLQASTQNAPAVTFEGRATEGTEAVFRRLLERLEVPADRLPALQDQLASDGFARIDIHNVSFDALIRAMGGLGEGPQRGHAGQAVLRWDEDGLRWDLALRLPFATYSDAFGHTLSVSSLDWASYSCHGRCDRSPQALLADVGFQAVPDLLWACRGEPPQCDPN